MTELYAIFLGLDETIRDRFKGVRCDHRVYGHDNQYQLFISKTWGNTITINILPYGFQIYRTSDDERLFLFEDQDSVDNTLNYLEELLKFKYRWEI